MFLGTYTPSLDDKGRLILPARFREELAAGLVVTKGQERCLAVWTAEGFAELTAQMRSASRPGAPDAAIGRSSRDYHRVFFASAYDCQPDAQGRIVIPPPLRAYAGLSRECVVIGADTRLEVWDAAAWADYLAGAESAFSASGSEAAPDQI
ncbi:MraZ protein [Catenulispora sp. MAP12-49]|uniref:division/cell wall cluster transcriptional repressor MraZ n=1 Tax=Catenulispora sp. MAP12-49 TaxID=3156302 RepID=UPI00351891FC